MALALLVAPQSTWAQASDPSKLADTKPDVCGKTVAENVAAARQALQSNASDKPNATACLLEAVDRLSQQLANVELGRSQSGRLQVPVTTYTLLPNQ